MKNLSLNKLLLSISYMSDYIELDLIGDFTNHSRRVAYISIVVANELNLSQEECFDIVA